MGDIDRARNYFAIISNELMGDSPGELQARVDMIRQLEKITGKEFKNTADFIERMEKLFSASNQATALREERERLGWTQARLAAFLGVSQQMIAKMENGSKPLNLKALRFLEQKRSDLASVPHAQLDFGCKYIIDNKEDTDSKNGGHGPINEGGLK